MLEVVVLSLFVGSLGLQTVMLGAWQVKQFNRVEKEQAEEEETLTRYDSQDYMVASEISNGSSASPSHPSETPVSIAANPAPSKHNGSTPHGASPSLEEVTDPRLSGWEFKIVRADHDIFRNPAIFQKLCREEAESGWLLLEKLDDRRVRFRRPMALREIIKPEFLHHDPYRTRYGYSSGSFGSWIFGLAFLVVATSSAYLGYALVKVTLAQGDTSQPAPIPAQSFPTLPGTLPSPNSSPAQ